MIFPVFMTQILIVSILNNVLHQTVVESTPSPFIEIILSYRVINWIKYHVKYHTVMLKILSLMGTQSIQNLQNDNTLPSLKSASLEYPMPFFPIAIVNLTGREIPYGKYHLNVLYSFYL